MPHTFLGHPAFRVGLALAFGFAGLIVLWLGFRDHSRPLPEASGDAGFLSVYAQTPGGPVRLVPGRTARLPRPQDFAFQWSVDGTGLRNVQIEIDEKDRRYMVREMRLDAPASNESLALILTLGEEMPDLFEIYVTVESPHMMPYTSRYPIRLTGKNQRFWVKDPAATSTSTESGSRR
jgi:hypothetical protein